MEKKTIYISIGVGILVCIIVVVVVYFILKDKPKIENQEGASTQTPPSSLQKTETLEGAEIPTTQTPSPTLPTTEKPEGASIQTPQSSLQKTETLEGAKITTTQTPSPTLPTTEKPEGASIQTPQSSFQPTTKDAWQLRYLKVSRTTANYIDLVSIEAWYNTTRIYAAYVAGGPQFEGNQFPYKNANDNNYTTFAHTDNSKDAFIRLDFGQDIRANKVRVVFRNTNIERDTNIVLTVIDYQEREVFRVTHTKYCKEMSLLYPNTSIITSNTIGDWNAANSQSTNSIQSAGSTTNTIVLPPPRAPRLTAFSSNYYRDKNPDVVFNVGGGNATLFHHYLTTGINEGRQPIPTYAPDAEFDCHEYIHRYPVLKGMKWGDNKHYNCDTAETHYYNEGRHLGLTARYIGQPGSAPPKPRAPRVTAFSEKYYRNTNIDVLQKIGGVGGTLFHHYLTTGINEGRPPIPAYASDAEFDCHEYIHRYPDLKGMKWGDNKHYNCDSLETHYYSVGKNQGLVARYLP